jgi:uncharacterized DUF497 family protein
MEFEWDEHKNNTTFKSMELIFVMPFMFFLTIRH